MLIGAYCLANWAICLSVGHWMAFSVFLAIYSMSFMTVGWISRPEAGVPKWLRCGGGEHTIRRTVRALNGGQPRSSFVNCGGEPGGSAARSSWSSRPSASALAVSGKLVDLLCQADEDLGFGPRQFGT